MKSSIFICLVLVSLNTMVFSQHNFRPKSKVVEYTKVKLGGGPEDFVLDTLVGNRLLLSCQDRRIGNLQGSIWVYNLVGKLAYEIPFEPILDFDFHPHGIHLLNENDTTYLFVINHITKNMSEVDRFVVEKNRLVLDHRFTDILGNPNDLFAINSSEFFYSDYKVRKGSIVHYKNGEQKVVQKLNSPNGLLIKDNLLYFCTTMKGTFYKTNLETGKTEKIVKMKGGDNIMSFSETEVLVATHPSSFRFVLHVMKGSNKAPTLIYKVNLISGEKGVFYSEKGENISASSTALYHQNKLYLSQIFEPFLLIAE